MKLTKEQIEHVAQLARLRFSEEERDRFQDQLANIIGYVDLLNEVDTAGVEPVTTVFPMENVFREDEVRSPLPQGDFLSLAPLFDHGHYKVPKVIE